MTTQITYPQHPILKKIIQYFIFIKKEDNHAISQVCYPNTNHCLSFTKQSKLVRVHDNEYTFVSSHQEHHYLTGIYKKPIVISSHIPYEEVCINFNPLGLESIFKQKKSSCEFNSNMLKENDWEILREIIFSCGTNKLLKKTLSLHYE